MNRKNVCIIGAGIGGLATGALLSKQGYNVHIFEREAVLGGRALSLNGSSLTMEDYTGILSRFDMKVPFAEPPLETLFDKQMFKHYTLDLGFHLIGGGRKSIPLRVLTGLDKNVKMMGTKVGYIQENGFYFPFLSRTDKFKMLPRIIQLLISKESTISSLDSVPISKTIKKYGRGKMTQALELFSRTITTVNDLNKISTGETLRSQANLIRGSDPVGYPNNGLQSLSQAFADFIIDHHGKIKMNTPVEEIIIENNRAQGVVVDNTQQLFDMVISNIPVQDLFFIANKSCFPKEYIRSVEGLKATGSVCAYYSLKKVDDSLLGKSFMFIERDAGIDGNDAVGMIDFMTASPETYLAPRGHYLVQSYIICTPEEAKNKKITEKLRCILDVWLERLIPDFHTQMDWAIYPAVWHLDGVAKTIDNIKPEIGTPVDNLYLVGDCVKSPDIGINCAINSAKILQAMVSRK